MGEKRRGKVTEVEIKMKQKRTTSRPRRQDEKERRGHQSVRGSG